MNLQKTPIQVLHHHLSSGSKLVPVLFVHLTDQLVTGLSLEELGMRALERLPRDRAIDGIHAFNGMRFALVTAYACYPSLIFRQRDDLIKYLRPFAQDGKVVNESDVREFFASLPRAHRN
jgi:E3 ubiquitin-protein ligase UBR7